MANDTQLANVLEEVTTQSDVLLAEHIENLPIDELCETLAELGAQKASELFAYFPASVKKEVLLNVPRSFIYQLVEYSFTDDIKELIEDSDEALKQRILDNVSPLKKRQLTLQLQFKMYSAGSLMSMDFVELSPDDTVVVAMNKIKSQEKIAETISYCYVTNEQHTLLGIVSMRDILLAPNDVTIKDIMTVNVISVLMDDDQEDVANVLSKYDFVALPVVNAYHQMLGIVTIDDVLDIISEEITEDIQKMGGMTPTVTRYLDMSIVQIAKSRLFWLLILMVSATISGTIINQNAAITLKLPSLLVFMPMLMDTAGNAGSQSSAMVIRGIIVDQLTFRQAWPIVKKEMLASAVLGGVLFLVNTLRIVLFMPEIAFSVAILVSTTVLLIVFIANLIGGLLPVLATTIRVDPATMSGPVLTTVCDAISLTIYFALATIYLGGVI
ncbi:magnesium transporter [Carnobacteriaceae bacterium zg-C25]|nr:magnesium transporter [Carnobacteriaceae bacterium zg-C25]